MVAESNIIGSAEVPESLRGRPIEDMTDADKALAAQFGYKPVCPFLLPFSAPREN